MYSFPSVSESWPEDKGLNGVQEKCMAMFCNLQSEYSRGKRTSFRSALHFYLYSKLHSKQIRIFIQVAKICFHRS